VRCVEALWRTTGVSEEQVEREGTHFDSLAASPGWRGSMRIRVRVADHLADVRGDLEREGEGEGGREEEKVVDEEE
jgi:hypothetical protein